MKRAALLFLLLLASCAQAPTRDLYVDAVSARATADAALQQAQLGEQYLTATAQAPIVHITETAAGLIVQGTQRSIDATETARSWTATPSPVPSITPSPTANATTTLVFAQLDLEIERAQNTNTLHALGGYLVALVALIVALALAYVLIRRLAMMPTPIDERGRAVPMTNVLDGFAWDIERAPNGATGTGSRYLAQLPAITAERQDATTARAQAVDLATRARLPGGRRDAEPRALPSPVEFNTAFDRPSWDLLAGWDGRGIPYYTGQGLEVIDIDQHPHLAVIGATGAGKSRRFIRPLIACALAAGHRVVIIGKSADYWPFASHHNASVLQIARITEPGQAQRYARILEAIVGEMNRRDEVLAAAHQSTWIRAGHARTWLILDELGNALRLMDRETSAQARIWIEGLVAEGRKAGFNVVLANQRATGLASILSQTGKAIFKIEPDEERAHRSLVGASSLHEGYFLARFDRPRIAGAFEPTDDQLQAFLASRPAARTEPDQDDWIDAIATDRPEQLPGPKPETAASLIGSLSEHELKIIEMLQAGSSQRAIEIAVYGYNGGAASNRVKQVADRYRATTTTGQNGPNLAPAAA